MNKYLSNLEYIQATMAFSYFRSMRMNLGCLGKAGSDCVVEISQLVTEIIFKDRRREILKRIKDLTTYAVDNPVSFRFSKLDLETLQVAGFSDARFANY